MEPRLLELLEGNPEDEVRAVARLRESHPPPESVRVISQFRDVVTIRLRRGDIPKVRAHPAIASLKAPSLATDPDDEDDSEGRGRAVYRPQRPNISETGRGIVVGIVDVGADILSGDFRDPSKPGNPTRIRSAYIMNDRGPASGNNKYGRGRIISQEEINAALQSDDPYEALDYHPGRWAPEGGSHGSHVMGIAASNGQESGITGIAPESEIIYCQPDSSDLDRKLNFGDNVGILECLSYITDVAGDAPTVINFSLGRTAGSHDGTAIFEIAGDSLLEDRGGGLAIVNSAGNYYSQRVHHGGNIEAGESRTIRWRIAEGDRSGDELEVWYSNADEIDIALEAPDGTVFGPASRGDTINLVIDGERVGTLYSRPDREPNSQKHMINVFLRRNRPTGTWKITLFGEQVTSGAYDAWIERGGQGRQQSRFAREDADTSTTIGTIANAHKMISVGSFDARFSHRPIPFFSSAGPTTDGRRKPDIIAPGCRVESSGSPPLNGESKPTSVKSGTSMSAPHVTGTVALMMEAAQRPLTIDEIREDLFLSADTPPENDDRHRAGHGYLNIEKAVERARQRRSEASMTKPEVPETTEDQSEIDLGEEVTTLRLVEVETNDRHVRVRVREERSISIEHLADLLKLPKRRVFNTLLRYDSVLRHLWSDTGAAPPDWQDNPRAGRRYPGQREARRVLRRIGLGPESMDLGTGRPYRPFWRWEINGSVRSWIRFPLSDDFRTWLANRATQRQQSERRAQLAPKIALVDEVARWLLSRRRLARLYRQWIEQDSRRPLQEIALVDMMMLSINAMLNPRSLRNISNTRLREERRRDMRVLRNRVRILQDRATQYMLIERSGLAQWRRESTALARSMRRKIEAPAFIDALRDIGRTPELLPDDVRDRLVEALDSAYRSMIASPIGEEIVNQHILPLIQAVAAEDYDYSGFSLPRNPSFLHAVQDAPTPPRSDSAIVILWELFRDQLANVVGNTPGPDPIWLAVVEASGTILMQRVMKAAERAPSTSAAARISRQMSARLYRYLTTAARMDRGTRVSALAAIGSGDTRALHQLDWNQYRQTGIKLNSLLAVLSLAALINTIRHGDFRDVQTWADVIGSLAGVGTAAAQVGLKVAESLRATSSLMQKGLIQTSAKALGVVGGVATIISSGIEAHREDRRGDIVGRNLQITMAAGGVLTVGGFLLGAALASSATGIGAPLGAILAVIGGILTIGAAIWDAVRNWRRTDGHELFEAVLEHFARTGGDFRFVQRQVSEAKRWRMQDALRQVQLRHNRTRFWDVSLWLAPDLRAAGMKDEHIALLTGRSTSAVRRHVRQRGSAETVAPVPAPQPMRAYA